MKKNTDQKESIQVVEQKTLTFGPPMPISTFSKIVSLSSSLQKESEVVSVSSEKAITSIHPLTGAAINPVHQKNILDSPAASECLSMFAQIYKVIHPSTHKSFATIDVEAKTPFILTNKAHHTVTMAHHIMKQSGTVPDSWKPYLGIILIVLQVTKLFTPAHIDVLIDEMIIIINKEMDKQ